MRITKIDVEGYEILRIYALISAMSDKQLIDEITYYIKNRHREWFNLTIVDLVKQELERRGYKLVIKVTKKGDEDNGEEI